MNIEDQSTATQSAPESEEFLQLLLATGEVGTWDWCPPTLDQPKKFSTTLLKMLGLPCDQQVTHEIFLQRVHPEDRDELNRRLQKALKSESGGNFDVVYRAIRENDGMQRCLRSRGKMFFDEQGRAVRFMGTVMDITELKHAEEALVRLNIDLERRIAERTADLENANAALLESQRQLRETLEVIPTQVWCASPDGTSDYQNRRWLEYAGLSKEEAHGWGWKEALHPDDAERYLNFWREILIAGESGEAEARFRRFDGIYRWFLMRAFPQRDDQDNIVRWYGVNTDVDDSKAASRIVAGHLAALTELIGALVQEKDPDRLLEHVGRMIQNQTGCDKVSFWAKNEKGVIEHLAAFFNNSLHSADGLSEPIKRAARYCIDHPIWHNIARSGSVCVEGDFQANPPMARIAGGANSEWVSIMDDAQANEGLIEVIEQFRALGVLSTLSVPMVNSGVLEGKMNIFFRQRRDFCPDELELIKVLARQAMLMTQIVRLSRQSRATAVLEERSRLARDIHDTLAQGFTGVIMQLQAACGAAAKKRMEQVTAHLQRAEDLARISLQEARRSVKALRPRSLDHHTLQDAMKELVVRTCMGTMLDGRFRMEGVAQRLPAETEEGFLRIAQEALTNTLKHASATRFQATLTFSSEQVELRLADDGCGFQEDDTHNGFGLLGMRERADRMGASFSLRAKRGTEILVTLNPTTPIDATYA